MRRIFTNFFTQVLLCFFVPNIFCATEDATEKILQELRYGTDETVESHFQRLDDELKKGNNYALLIMGFHFEFGGIVRKDYEKAASYYRKAAEANIPDGYYYLAYLYEKIASMRDMEKAITLYEKAFALGDAVSAYTLGRIYARGLGIKPDYVEAEKWFQKYVAIKGVAGEIEIAILYVLHYEGTPLFEKGMATLKKYLEVGNPEAQCGYAEYLFHSGRAHEAEAIAYFKMAAEQGYGLAYRWLGVLATRDKDGRCTNPAGGVKYLRKGAELGQADCQALLGSMYYQGYGVKRDYAEAFKWLRAASEQQHPDARYYLGEAYYNGVYVEQDYKKAAVYFNSSASQKNAKAQMALSRMYFQGIGVQKNSELALDLLKDAAANGNDDAKLGLRLFKQMGEAAFLPTPVPAR